MNIIHSNLVFVFISYLSLLDGRKNKPNIIVILVDDIGVNDVSWNNPSSPTPNLGHLAEEGIILDSAYTLPVCSPSRAALMTGVYPFKMGLQRGFGKHTPEGVPLNFTLLPEFLKKEGYTTHGFGKWHLGFCSESYTPLKRGFDSFYGLFVGDEEEATSLNSMKLREQRREQRLGKRDIRQEKRYSNEAKNSLSYNKKKSYKRDKKYKSKNKKKRLKPSKLGSMVYGSEAMKVINTRKRRDSPFFIYLALFTKSYPREIKTSGDDAVQNNRKKKLMEMDSTVGDIISSLKTTGQYNNTIVLLMSDNGARAVSVPGQERLNPNYPLKGSKGSLYEGGTKVPAFLHSPLLNDDIKGTRYNGLFHMVDVLPTILNLVNRKWGSPSENMDGINQWKALTNQGIPAPRTSMIYNIDDNSVPSVLYRKGMKPKFQMAVRQGKYKLLWGQSKMMHRSYREAKSRGGLIVEPQVLELYNLEKDPSETKNLAPFKLEAVARLKTFALNYYRELIPPRFLGLQTTNQVLDSQSDFGGLSGWCRAVKDTKCTSLSREDKNEFQVKEMMNGEGHRMVELFYGTIPLNYNRKSICVTNLE